jgi:outer membrane protein assembly factor BamB
MISGTYYGIWSAPAVAEGRVYTGCNDGRVYCFNAITGALIWNTAVLTNYFPGHPVVDNGRVYIGGADTLQFFCLDAATGATLWTSPTHGNCYDCSPAVANGFVYFTDSWGRTVYCLNAVTGASKWTYTLGYNGGWGSTAVVNGMVYCGSTDNRVIALDADTGALVWSYTTGAEVYGSPAVADGKVYIASYDGNLYCLNAATGAFIWSYTGLGAVGGKSASIVNGIVYMLTKNDPGQLLAFGGYYLTVKTDPPGTATISGEGWYDPGTPVTLTAPTGPPGATLSFLNWDLDGTPETANPLVVTMSGPHTATAHYYKIPVGGEWAPIDTAQIVTPWIALAFLAIAFAAAGSHRLLKKRW